MLSALLLQISSYILLSYFGSFPKVLEAMLTICCSLFLLSMFRLPHHMTMLIILKDRVLSTRLLCTVSKILHNKVRHCECFFLMWSVISLKVRLLLIYVTRYLKIINNIYYLSIIIIGCIKSFLFCGVLIRASQGP